MLQFIYIFISTSIRMSNNKKKRVHGICSKCYDIRFISSTTFTHYEHRYIRTAYTQTHSYPCKYCSFHLWVWTLQEVEFVLLLPHMHCTWHHDIFSNICDWSILWSHWSTIILSKRFATLKRWRKPASRSCCSEWAFQNCAVVRPEIDHAFPLII